MNPFKARKFKTLQGRKPVFTLSFRQRKNILHLLQHINQRGQNTRPDNTDDANNTLIDVAPTSQYNYSSDQMSLASKQCIELCSSADKLDVDDNDSFSHFQSNVSSVNVTDDDTIVEINPSHVFQETLALSFIQGNLTHTQGNLILKALRTLPSFTYLPKDTRTLLHTPRGGAVVREINPGEYLHVGFEKSLIRILQKTPPHLIPNVLEVDWSTDGARLNNSGNIQIWPIQCSIANIATSKPEVVGVYKGPKKPDNIDLFLKEFIDDVLQVIDRGGVSFLQKQFSVVLRAFIADAPARSWLLNHFGHTSSNPCSKCRVIGTSCDGQMVFVGTNHRLRTDDEYSRLDDEDHHKGPSPLSRLPMGMVSQVPIEYMHLICIGTAKKLLTAWIIGKYGKKMKFSGRNQNLISKRLEHIARYCPRNFSRKPRPLTDYKDYKATEGRQFTLYTGPVVLQGIMEKQGYLHYLLFHAAIRALCHSSPSSSILHFAQLALEKFVENCPHFYKHTFLSYNVHALLHLVKDVERLGPLDSFSAFPYENNMIFFRKYYRKPHRPLQQFAYRQAEKEKREELKPLTDADRIKLFDRHNEGPLPVGFSLHGSQYKRLQTTTMFLGINSLGDKCCILNDLSVCIIRNIFVNHNSYFLVINKFEIVEDFYDVGIPSSSIGIYKCFALCTDLSVVSFNDVKAKCYLMPCWTVDNDEGSDSSIIEGDEPIIGKYIVSVLL